jgi:hypothetical protein
LIFGKYSDSFLEIWKSIIDKLLKKKTFAICSARSNAWLSLFLGVKGDLWHIKIMLLFGCISIHFLDFGKL